MFDSPPGAIAALVFLGSQAGHIELPASQVPRSGAEKTQHPRVPRSARARRSASRGAVVGQANGNIPDWNINDEEVRLQRRDHRDVGQTLDADWPSPIFPRHHPSGFAAVNAEEAHGFQSNGSGTDRRKKGRSDQAVPYAPTRGRPMPVWPSRPRLGVPMGNDRQKRRRRETSS